MIYDFDQTGGLTEEDFMHKLRLKMEDPASASALAYKYPWFHSACSDFLYRAKTIANAEPFPDVDKITAVQVNLFDNWPNGVRVENFPNQYTASVEVWISEKISIERKGDYQHKSNVILMNAKNLTESVNRNLKKKSIRADWGNDLLNFAGGMTEDHLTGIITTKGLSGKNGAGGTKLHANQAVLATMKPGEPEGLALRLFLNGKTLDLPPFVKTTASGKKLPAKVVVQSRLDVIGFSADWSTKWDTRPVVVE